MEFNQWARKSEVAKGPTRFYIPYHRTDTFPELPGLVRSGTAGCELCIAIRREAQSLRDAVFRKSFLGIFAIDSEFRERKGLMWKWIIKKAKKKATES
jgi:hypothetical protein